MTRTPTLLEPNSSNPNLTPTALQNTRPRRHGNLMMKPLMMLLLALALALAFLRNVEHWSLALG